MTATQEQDEPNSSWVAVFLQSRWSLLLLFVLCSYITVSGCLTAPLIQLDDAHYINENPLLKQNVPWSNLITEPAYYQRIPVTMISYRLNAAVFGLETAWAYRLVNLILHALSALILLGVLVRIGLARREALFIAALWAVHPMACESVGWVSQRRNVLGFFFGILALYAHVRWSGRLWGFILTPLAYALAVFSCPLALGWMPIFVAVEALGGVSALSDTETPPRFRPRLRSSLGLLSLVLLAGLVAWIGVSGYARTFRPPPGGSMWTALMTDTDIFLRYLSKTFVPVQLSAMYGVNDIESLADLRLWVNLVIWVAVIGGSIALGRSRTRTLLGWLWFLGGLGPACNMVAIGYPMQDRYVYISAVGLFLVLVETAAGIAKRWSISDRSRIGIAVPVVYVIFVALAAADRSAAWSDSLVLMRRAVEAQPESALANIFYGRQLGLAANELHLTGQEEASREYSKLAVQHLKKGLSLPDAYLFNPVYARVQLARYLVRAGEGGQAIKILDECLLPPDAPKTEFPGEPSCYTFVGPRFGFVYTLSRDALCEGYRRLSEAYLQEFLDRTLTPDDARPLLKSAVTHSITALKIVPGSPDSQCLRATLLLAEESFVRTDISREDAVKEARDRARMVEPELIILCHIEPVSRDLKERVSLARIRALGCLGMARARFEPVLRKNFPPEEVRQRFDDAVAWCKRAGEQDPTLGESFFYMARLHHHLYAAAHERNATEMMETQRQACIMALKRVPKESARYEYALKNLQLLQAGDQQTTEFK